VVTSGIGENAPEPRTTVGKGCQRRALDLPDGIHAPTDQRFEVRISFVDSGENLLPTTLRFDIANPHLQVVFAVLAAAHEGQGEHDRGTAMSGWAAAHAPTALRVLEVGQQPLRFGQGQTQIGDAAAVIRPVDLHDVYRQPFSRSPDFHRSQNPGHAPRLPRMGAQNAPWRSHPQSCGSPAWPSLP
jgi:hypothetical protein